MGEPPKLLRLTADPDQIRAEHPDHALSAFISARKAAA
jgi:hypothetical protein